MTASEKRALVRRRAVPAAVGRAMSDPGHAGPDKDESPAQISRTNDEDRPRAAQSSSRNRNPEGIENGGHPITVAPRSKSGAKAPIAVPMASVNADPAERKRSALVGVAYAKAIHETALAAHGRARANLSEAIIAARDEGVSVARIASAAGTSRNAVYLLMSRVKRSAKREAKR